MTPAIQKAHDRIAEDLEEIKFRNGLVWGTEEFSNTKMIIGMQTSGGVDSSMAMYAMCDYLKTNNLDYEIQPIHGWDNKRSSCYTPEVMQSIVDYIQNKFPEQVIHPTAIYAYHKLEHESKSKYTQPWLHYLYREQKIHCSFAGGTLEPTDVPELSYAKEGEPELRTLEYYEEKRASTSEPGSTNRSYDLWYNVDKKYIAQLYVDYDVLDMFPLTVSCIRDKGHACKECWWCKEKYWAFGAYDGGTPWTDSET